MKAPHPGQVLFIDKNRGKKLTRYLNVLSSANIDVTLDNDLGTAIHRFQKNRFDTVVVDANMEGMPIERIIQILKDIDPTTKIIVKTEKNSKELEAKIRNEMIYYYHLASFGPDDLKLAVDSAIQQKAKSDNVTNKQINEDGRQLILMVDEDDRFVEIHKNNLINFGYQVEICYDADEGIALTKQKKPDFILVDIDTPVGSAGLHFIEMLMNEKEFLTIPLMVFISRTKSEKYEKMLARAKTALPTWTYMEKPVKIEEVIPKLKALIA
jgi:DNA-binding response OmpR family regulator